VRHGRGELGTQAGQGEQGKSGYSVFVVLFQFCYITICTSSISLCVCQLCSEIIVASWIIALSCCPIAGEILVTTILLCN
jgi:hypothetical protein